MNMEKENIYRIMIEFGSNGASKISFESNQIPLELLVAVLKIQADNFERELITNMVMQKINKQSLIRAVPNLPSLEEIKKTKQ